MTHLEMRIPIFKWHGPDLKLEEEVPNNAVVHRSHYHPLPSRPISDTHNHWCNKQLTYILVLLKSKLSMIIISAVFCGGSKRMMNGNHYGTTFGFRSRWKEQYRRASNLHQRVLYSLWMKLALVEACRLVANS